MSECNESALRNIVLLKYNFPGSLLSKILLGNLSSLLQISTLYIAIKSLGIVSESSKLYLKFILNDLKKIISRNNNRDIFKEYPFYDIFLHGVSDHNSPQIPYL